MKFEYEGKTEKAAIEKAAAELKLERDQFDVEILETQKNTLFKKGYVKIRIHTQNDDNVKHVVKSDEAPKRLFADPLPKNEFENKIVDYVVELVKKMGYDTTVEFQFREDHKIGLKLNSNNSSILIGRKGKNIDALQLLTNVFAGRIGGQDIRVILDTENYRIRREETLVRLAYNTADEVRINRHSVLLEPMNPFERRLIHTTLNDISDVETKSDGDGLYKQVRVIYKGIR